jgi:PEGA domain
MPPSACRLFIAAVAFVAALISARPACAEQATGGVYVATLPAGADVWIDGTYVGRSPVFADALPLGHHTLTITKTGWSLRELDVDIGAHETALASVKLLPKSAGTASKGSGAFALRGLPPGAKVSVDGMGLADPLGSTPATPGQHRIAVTTARGRMTRSFTVLPDTTTEVVLHEPPAGAARSAVIAPADDYLPTQAYELEGTKVVVRYASHVVVAHLGESTVRFDGVLVSYAGTAQTIGRKLYLPLELLERLSGDVEPSPSHTR